MVSLTHPPAPLVCVQLALRGEATDSTSARAQVVALPHVVRLISDCLDYQFWSLPRACEANLLSLLPRLIAWGAAEGVDPYYWRFQCGKGLVWAVKHNNLAMVEWLHECCPEILPYAAMIEAARLGRLSMLEWLTENHDTPRLPHLVDAAASTGQLETVQWLRARGYGFTKEAMTDAMQGGFYEILVLLDKDVDTLNPNGLSFGLAPFVSGDVRIPQLLLNRHEDDDTYNVDLGFGMMKALENGDIHVAEWCLEKLGSLFEPGYYCGMKAMDFAAKSGQLDVVQWCHQRFPDACTTLAMPRAAFHGHLDIIQWLHENRTEGCTWRAMDDAVPNGHLEVIQWLHANRTEGCTVWAMDCAAASGDLEMVQWLHENRSEGCTTGAMDGAAANDHMQVFEWLAANRTEGCTSDAMDHAAMNGHLAVVQRLHDHRTEGCTTRAMNGASACGHLDVVKWLHSHRTEGCTTQAMDGAAGNGHLQVVQWLHEHRTEGCTARAMGNAVDYGHMDVVLFLHSIGSEAYRDCISTAAIKCMDHLEIVQWLYATYPSIAVPCHHLCDYGYLGHILLNDVGWDYREGEAGQPCWSSAVRS